VRRRNSDEPGRNRLRGSFHTHITRTAGAIALVVLVALLASPAGVAARQAPNLRPFAEYESIGVLVMSAADGFGAAAVKRELLRHLPEGVSVVLYGPWDTPADQARVIEDYGRHIDAARLRYLPLPKAARGFWSRDPMPVPLMSPDGRLMLTDAKYWSGFEPDVEIGRLLAAPIQKHGLQFEGGNFAANHLGDCLVVQSRSTNKITDDLFASMYGCRTVIRLPKKGGIGHIDERARFVNARTIVTDTPEYASLLGGRGFVVVPIARPAGKDDTYVNALFVNGTAFVPQYGRPEDAAALAVYERLGFIPVGFDSRTLSARGLGSIHCLVMTYPHVAFDRTPDRQHPLLP
jgi:Porphyromonas-type peptidyl-arginine deiminase